MENEQNGNEQSRLPLPSQFQGGNSPMQGKLWTKWFKNFRRYRIASGLRNRPENEQVATVLYVMGDSADEVLIALGIDRNEATYDEVIDALNKYYNAKTNIIDKRAEFNMKYQLQGESVDYFIKGLYKLAAECEYGSLRDERIRDRIAVGVHDDALIEKLHSVADLTLAQAIYLSKQTELDKESHIVCVQETEAVNINSRTSAGLKKGVASCLCCSITHEQEDCSAMDAICTKCSKGGDLPKPCWTVRQRVNKFNKDSSFLDTNYHEDYRMKTEKVVNPLIQPQTAASTEKCAAINNQDFVPNTAIQTEECSAIWSPGDKELLKSKQLKLNAGITTEGFTGLSRSFSSASNGNPQNLIKTNNKPFVCKTCGKEFHLLCRLKPHMLMHSGEKPHVCNDCGKGFHLVRYLKKHVLVHTVNRSHKCDNCGNLFSDSNKHKKHKLNCLGEKQYVCSVCGKEFSLASNLKRHTIIHTRKAHVCKECGHGFTELASLELHMNVHTGKLPFACSECDKTFNYRHTLKTHMLTHTGEKPHLCSECGKGFSHLGSLKGHMMIHTGMKPFECPDCGKAFRVLSVLNSHMLVHSGEKSHACAECGKKFRIKSSLNIHMATHTGEKPHLCAECGTGFRVLTHLKRHMVIHAGTKQFVCSDCGKDFGQLATLKTHMMIHTGEKPHVCTDCDKGFNQLGSLKRHMATCRKGRRSQIYR